MLTKENAVKTRIGQESLCWTCGKSITNGCSWATEFKPVQGWIARKRGYATVKGAYDVRYCPEYENDSCYVKKDDFWGDCTGDCYSCPHWRDSYGNKFNKKERQPKGEEEETDFDYQRAIEQLEHDILYEPTFNPDDGSM